MVAESGGAAEFGEVVVGVEEERVLHEREQEPLISGAALGLEGQLTVYNYSGGPCYRCLFPTPPPTTACQRCADSGVLGVEAIKVAGGIGEPLSGRLLLLDALSGRIRIMVALSISIPTISLVVPFL